MNIGKECTRCHEFKSLDEFHKRTGGKYGKQDWCKLCIADYDKNKAKFRKTKKRAKQEGKICTKCGFWKEFKHFNRASSAKDGHQSYCKVCKREYQRGRYALNRTMGTKPSLAVKRKVTPAIKEKIVEREVVPEGIYALVELLGSYVFPNAKETVVSPEHAKLILKYPSAKAILEDVPKLIESKMPITIDDHTVSIKCEGMESK